MLTDRQLAVLQVVAGACAEGRLCPKLAVISERAGIRGTDLVALVLRELQELRLLRNAPGFCNPTTVRIHVTEQGFEAAGVPRVLPPQVEAAARTGWVTEPRWRCIDCNDVTFSPGKPCVICPLLPSAVLASRTGAA